MTNPAPTLPPLPSTIANLNNADTPLTGNELTVIVQNGVTKRTPIVSITDLSGINVGTAGQIAYYAATGAHLSGTSDLTIFNGALTIGIAGSTQGSILLAGSSGGVTTLAAPTTGGGTLTLPSGTDTLVGQSSIRTKLAGNTDYYVSTTGNDSNLGTIGSPWLTIQHAINVIEELLDLQGFTITVHLADGTYGPFAFTKPIIGGGATSVTINGNSGTPSNVVISTNTQACVTCQYGAPGAVIQNLKLTNSVGDGIFINTGQISLGAGLVFGICGQSHMIAFSTGVITPEASYTINGGAQAHFNTLNGGLIDVGVFTITLTGTPAFSTACAVCQGSGSNIYFEAVASVPATFSGSATGVRYAVSNNGVINTQGSGTTYLPGDSSGIGTNSGTTPFGLYT